MPGSKKWCAHPTRHVNDTKIGRRPSHPQGHHPISAQLARNIQTQYCRSIGMKKIYLKEGDRLCKICYYRERARFDKLYSSQGESMEIDDQEIDENVGSMDISNNIRSFKYFIINIFSISKVHLLGLSRNRRKCRLNGYFKQYK